MASSSTNSQQQRNETNGLILDEFKATIDINCPICFEVFNDPLLLRCGHTFCKKCTDTLIQGARENAQQQYHYGTPSMACPECRAEMPADRRALVKNYRLADIIHQFNSLKTDSTDAAAAHVVNNPSPAPRPEIKCNTCGEMTETKHIFYCLWCSTGRPDPFFACGTCCVNVHNGHEKVPHSQMSTPEEREIFVNNVMTMLRDASNNIQADFNDATRITPEYHALKNKMKDSFIHWDPVLNNLRTNSKLTKSNIDEHNDIISNFLNLCHETVNQLKQIEKKHSDDVNGLCTTFSANVVTTFNTFNQSPNIPMISLPSTSSPLNGNFAYPGPNRHIGRPRRVVAFARRRVNNSNNATIRAASMFPSNMDRMNNGNHSNASVRQSEPFLQSQRPIDSDDDL
uniref:RING-type domain-containing protein n=1 Tax=Panagrolaimus sp. ES5 TaxID=591445 RepID=A0AC34FSA0_9BILA